MVEQIKKLSRKIQENKIYSDVTMILYPVLLVLFALCKVNKGLDITDSAYSLSNFRSLGSLDGMWFFSTFYANLLGGLFMKLPGGGTMLAMNIYTSLVKALLGLLAYFFFTKDIKAGRLVSLASVMIALGLCWCPTTILYNYLTYLIFGAGVVALFKGLSGASNRWLVWAGFLLGSNVLVRLPNLVEAGLIVVVWVYTAMKKESFKDGLFKTLWCIAGYVLAFIPGLIAVISTRGVGEYITGIKELMGMTSDATEYSTLGMIKQIIYAYINARYVVAVFIVFSIVAAVVYFVLVKKNKILAECAVLVLGVLMLIYYYRSYGLFSLAYNDYSAIYEISKLSLIVMLMFLAANLFKKDLPLDKKLLIMLAIMVAFITPIGSNNDVYSVFNNMFFILPVAIILLCDYKPWNESIKGVYILISVLLMCLFVQSFFFGLKFVFRDGQDAPLTSYVENNRVVKHMLTTEDNAKQLAELSTLWEEWHFAEESVLLYGNVSGLGYYLDTDVAISTAWPSLASFSAAKFEEDINELEIRESKPVVLISGEEYNNLVNDVDTQKIIILKKFLENNNYKKLYSNDRFLVMIAE